MGERTRTGAWQEGGTSKSGADIVGEAQGDGRIGRTVNRVDALARRPGQVEVTAESRVDVSAHGFWKQGTTTIFEIRTVNLNAGSYLRMMPEKAIVNTDKEKKDLYLQDCLERRHTFNPMVYSTDGIPGAEASVAQKRLAAILSYNLKREYSEMCGFVKERMSLYIVRSNNLLLRGPRDKEAQIRQRPEMTDATVMALIAPWQG